MTRTNADPVRPEIVGRLVAIPHGERLQLAEEGLVTWSEINASVRLSVVARHGGRGPYDHLRVDDRPHPASLAVDGHPRRYEA